MSRPKGSKNKSEIEKIIQEVKELSVDETQKQEAISELEDLFEEPKEEARKLAGYHPITGEEVWI
jgi:5,10-methenyltetrahydromethanopterin hydrogenase